MSAFAAAAITGGNPFRTMMQTWKYSLPAFLVPFAFILSPNGEALLLEGSVVEVVVATAMSSPRWPAGAGSRARPERRPPACCP